MIERFRNFINEMRHSKKAREIGAVSISDFYFYLTGEKAWTQKTHQNTAKFNRWIRDFWRPWSRAYLSKELLVELGIEVSVGREGCIATFSFLGD